MGFGLDMTSRDRSMQFCWTSCGSVQTAWILMQICLDCLGILVNIPHPLLSLAFCGGSSGCMHHYFSEATIIITSVTIIITQQRWACKISIFFPQGASLCNLPLIPCDYTDNTVSPVSSQLTLHLVPAAFQGICHHSMSWDSSTAWRAITHQRCPCLEPRV